jgi:hypothetical protein
VVLTVEVEDVLPSGKGGEHRLRAEQTGAEGQNRLGV